MYFLYVYIKKYIKSVTKLPSFVVPVPEKLLGHKSPCSNYNCLTITMIIYKYSCLTLHKHSSNKTVFPFNTPVSKMIIWLNNNYTKFNETADIMCEYSQ